MDVVPDEAEGQTVELRKPHDRGTAPRSDRDPLKPPSGDPIRKSLTALVQEGLRGPKGPGWALLGEFLTEPEPLRALKLWFGDHRALDRPLDRERLVRALDRDIAWVDALMRGLVDACLHHPRFQRLEASWRGLAYLVNQADGVEGAKIRVLNIGWAELCRDLQRAMRSR